MTIENSMMSSIHLQKTRQSQPLFLRRSTSSDRGPRPMYQAGSGRANRNPFARTYRSVLLERKVVEVADAGVLCVPREHDEPQDMRPLGERNTTHRNGLPHVPAA